LIPQAIRAITPYIMHEISPYLRPPMEVLPTDNFQPDVIFWGVRVGEPMVTLTSLLVASFCMFAWLRLGKIPRPDATLRLFRAFFLLMGLSSLTGGMIGHAFMHHFPLIFKTPGWVLGMLAVSALEQVSILRARPFLGARWTQALSWLNITQLMAALSFVFVTLWFPAVEIHSAVGFLLIVVPLEGMMFFKTRSTVSRYILLGISSLVGAVAVHILKLSAGVWFSYFDIAHLFMCGAIWMFMRGAERLTTDVAA
jgi:hypothetical protein